VGRIYKKIFRATVIEMEKKLRCKNCLEEITKEHLEFANKHGHFPDDCKHEDVCGCRNDDDNCICEFESI
jgi:hypothetical protein